MPHYLDIMGRSRPARFVAALALVCFVVGSTTRDALAAPPRYVATDLGSFPNSTVPLSPNAINDYGQVVFDNGFLWTPTAPNATTGTLTHPGDPFATPGSMI